MTLLELIENLQTQYDNMGEDAPVYVLVNGDDGSQRTTTVDTVNGVGDLVIHLGHTS